MSTVGLITEYNPFHLGHKYHIEMSKKLSGADTALVIMSGNYVQRGEPSFVDKYTKSRVALNNGADIVIELPYCFACASAEYFATAAVTLLDKLNTVDYICFGAECADLSLLDLIADILYKEPAEYKELLKKELKSGLSFPKARSKALSDYLNQYYPEVDSSSSLNILSTPNNILAVEYLKSLKKINSKIKPLVLERTHAGYHDSDTDKCFYSATAMRSLYNDEALLRQALSSVDNYYMESYNISYPVFTRDFDSLLGMSLLNCQKSGTYSEYFGVSETLANKISNSIYEYKGYASYIEALASKDINNTALSRALLHILLNITNKDIEEYMSNGIANFIRILGFNENGAELLGKINEKSNMKIICQMSEYNSDNALNSTDKKLIESWIKADHLYRMISLNKYHQNLPNEFTSKIIKI